MRAARAADAPAVAEFTSSTFAWGDYVSEAFAYWLAEPEGVLLVAEHEARGRVVGIVHVCVAAQGEGWLEGLRVHPEFRRQGIADTLNRAGQDWAAAQGALVVRLAVDAANAPARSQVANLGFAPIAVFVHGEAPADNSLPAESRPSLEIRLGLAADAAFVLGLWTRSTLGSGAAGLMSRGWRWFGAGQIDIANALRAFQVLLHPQGFAVLDVDCEPAELRWLEPGGRGALSALEVARLLALGARQCAGAVGRTRVRASLPVCEVTDGGLAAAGFEVSTQLVIYAASMPEAPRPDAQASPGTTW